VLHGSLNAFEKFSLMTEKSSSIARSQSLSWPSQSSGIAVQILRYIVEIEISFSGSDSKIYVPLNWTSRSMPVAS